MKLTEEEKIIGKKYYEITNSILGLKLGLFHVTNEFSYPRVDDTLGDIERDDDRLDQFIQEGLDFSNARKRFKDVKLTESAKNKKPHEKMNEYLTEAFWCYVAGMFKACVALCRTAMEMGIRDQLNKTILVNYARKDCDELIQEEEEHWKKGNLSKEKGLQGLIEMYLKTLSKRKGVSENIRKELKKSAHCVRIKGNIIVHSQKNIKTLDNEKESLDVLKMTRAFLAEIYSIM